VYKDQRFSDAAECWRQAAQLKHGPSHAHLSNLLNDGKPGVRKDRKRVIGFAFAGAALGCAHSKGVLGHCYVLGTAADTLSAQYCILVGLAFARESAAEGSCFGQYLVGVCHERGYGGPRNYVEAVRFYRLAAGQGHANAQVNLGYMFEHGEGVVQDYAEAVRLYLLAATQGHPDALNNLGFIFERGQGLAKDYSEAERLYRLAATQAHADATYNLGRLFQQGHGVKPDNVEAERLYSLAAAQGHACASDALKQLGA
jgi:uncharacterized protein